ncbi:uncharacterized protein LOC121367401 [Gigantopelta aegis]|uniref:uncharacterized protein LOC121367401 n=1 Tax=Gigantopelta aegis TaxID=1735272 RepID=UPI001B88A1BB|nr:uncharacterized protein LOC121367401 [Gigantopelta aegis]
MKWLLIVAALAAISSTLEAQTPVIRVNRESSYLPCRDRAVCSDLYNFTRTLPSGTRQEVRIVKNCKCPDNDDGGCPIVDDHMLHASTIHKQYMCNPIETLPICSENQSQPSAEDMVEGDEEFEFYNYWRINCRCPTSQQTGGANPEPVGARHAVGQSEARLG